MFGSTMAKVSKSIKIGLLLIIRLYQRLISPFIGSVCRFYPSCSHYAVESITTHGSTKGIFLTVRRLLRCQPLAKGGVDLVPKKN